MTTDHTEQTRRDMLPAMPHLLAMAIENGEQVWDNKQFREDFEVIGFMAPFVVVRRRSDGVKGSLEFSHFPRRYWGFKEDRP